MGQQGYYRLRIGGRGTILDKRPSPDDNRLDLDGWTVTETPVSLLIVGIPTRDHAKRLHEYLTGRGMLATMTMGDKRGATWVIVARDRTPGLLDDE